MRVRSFVDRVAAAITAALPAMVVALPAGAQAIAGAGLGGIGPTQIATLIAAGCLGILAAVSTVAGCIKATQVWSGHASWAEAGTRLGMGLGFGFGTAAAVGFNG